MRPTATKRKRILGLLLLFICAGLYWYGAVQQLSDTNDHIDMTDQDAYMEYAVRLRTSDYSYVGDRNRMPLYPLIQSLFYREELTQQEFFEIGKYNNLFLSILALVGIGLIASRDLGSFAGITLTLVTAFEVFIFKAGWFQAEILFYLLNFGLFVLLLRLWQDPSVKLAAVAGLIAGLAHLTKASVLPGLVLFLLFWILETVLGRDVFLRTTGRRIAGSGIVRRTLVALALSATFLLSISPYLLNSKRVYGRYFYNVNSTFYMWYDSWNEAKEGTKAHGDRVGWPDLPDEEIPSPGKYLRDHSLKQIILRPLHGGREVLRNVRDSYGYHRFVILYIVLLSLGALAKREAVWVLAKRNPFQLLFLLGYFGAYFLLYAWYAPIVAGNRLILAQFLPFLFVLTRGMKTLIGEATLDYRDLRLSAFNASQVVILILLVPDALDIVFFRVTTLYGGF